MKVEPWQTSAYVQCCRSTCRKVQAFAWSHACNACGAPVTYITARAVTYSLLDRLLCRIYKRPAPVDHIEVKDTPT